MKRILLILPLFLFIACTSEAQLDRTADKFDTDAGELRIQPVQHGTVALTWNGMSIYVDPWGGGAAFEGQPDPDLIFITDIHGDHLSAATLSELNTEGVIFIVPQAVADRMPDYKDQLMIIDNGETMNVEGIEVTAIPMYNLPETEDSRHTKGRGNGYILNMGGKQVYFSGDTEDIPEMRNLENIDIAFVCMNLPYTMDINQAASAVLDFEPAIVYPYHHRGQDIQEFKENVVSENNNIEVRLKNWYPESE
ncbi:MBL fold metallo-hydrolase [Balneola sp. MJW-20]|uniref:MBL fold metallo-hydrolase n=1 Tax=Gracilimonas aurantiaca TaxID=3234185 RepID=UPI0034656BD9